MGRLHGATVHRGTYECGRDASAVLAELTRGRQVQCRERTGIVTSELSPCAARKPGNSKPTRCGGAGPSITPDTAAAGIARSKPRPKPKGSGLVGALRGAMGVAAGSTARSDLDLLALPSRCPARNHLALALLPTSLDFGYREPMFPALAFNGMRRIARDLEITNLIYFASIT